ncbi:MAG: enoyl-CoA hydratase/isomerase family protein [Thiohalocapsa sp.]
MPTPDDVLIEKRGSLGLVTLNRPQQQNVLSLPMLRRIAAALDDFTADDGIATIMIGAVGRVFSAGGDVYGILAPPPGAEFDRFRREYFRSEFALDHRIHACPKPVVALLDGLTIGGGCGLALHARYVVTTERTIVSMPETAIGYFPDVGASRFLNRLPGRIGLYVGLRGLRLGAADVVGLGLAGHHVRAQRRDEFVAALAAITQPEPTALAAAIARVLAQFADNPGPSPVLARRPRIDELFAGDTVEDIVVALSGAGESWAEAALATLRHVCPMSLKVTLRLLCEGGGSSLAEALRTDYRVCLRLTGRDDFREGVRAVLVDKDNQPKWQPECLERVDRAAVAACFAPLEPAESELDLS